MNTYLHNESWLECEREYEIARLKAVLRNPDACAAVRAIATAQLEHHLASFDATERLPEAA
jgi:hypothetical protein